MFSQLLHPPPPPLPSGATVRQGFPMTQQPHRHRSRSLGCWLPLQSCLLTRCGGVHPFFTSPSSPTSPWPAGEGSNHDSPWRGGFTSAPVTGQTTVPHSESQGQGDQVGNILAIPPPPPPLIFLIHRLLWYPKDSHPISSVDSDADCFINGVLWFHKHMC